MDHVLLVVDFIIIIVNEKVLTTHYWSDVIQQVLYADSFVPDENHSYNTNDLANILI